MKRPSLVPLLGIFSVLALLAIGAWFYTNANDPVAGLPTSNPAQDQAATP